MNPRTYQKILAIQRELGITFKAAAREAQKRSVSVRKAKKSGWDRWMKKQDRFFNTTAGKKQLAGLGSLDNPALLDAMPKNSMEYRMNKLAYYKGYMNKEALPIWFGRRGYKNVMKKSPQFLRNWISGYNRFVRGKDINKSHKLLMDETLGAVLKNSPDPISQSLARQKYAKHLKALQGDTAKMHKLMVYLGVLPPVVSTGAAAGLTAAGSAAPYVIPTPTAGQKM